MHFGWKILLMSAHEREKQKEKDKTVLSFTETNLACFIIPSLMLTFQHLLGKPYILKTSWIQPYILNAWQSWAIAGIMNLGHQLIGVFFTLTSGIRDSFPVRTSFFVILKHKIYFTCILQLLFSLSSVSKLFFFLQPQAVIYLCEEYGPSLIVVGIATGRLRAGIAFCTAFYQLVHTGKL